MNSHLSSMLYKKFDDIHGYVGNEGFMEIRQKEMVLNALKAGVKDKITRRDVADLCNISHDQAYQVLKRLTKDGEISLYGKGRGAYYKLNT